MIEGLSSGREAQETGAPSILVIGAAVDQATMDLLKKVDPAPQVQTFRFHWAIIHAMEEASGSRVDILSTVPIRDFPYSRKCFWGLRRIEEWGRDGRQFTIMPFVNLMGFKQVTRFLSCLYFTFQWLWRKRQEPDKVMLLYGLIVSHLCGALILGRLFGVKVVALVTDPPPQSQPDENAFYALARVLDRWLLLWSLRRLGGLIVLAEATSRILAPEVPAIVVEGMISGEVVRFCARPDSAPAATDSADKFTIMYAGHLGEDYGVRLLLDAFQRLEGDGYALWICGAGPLIEVVRAAAGADPRIAVLGFLSDEDLFQRMRRASVLVNPRPLDERYTPFQFPSKLLEYVAMGKIVVSSRLKGIPREYHSHLVVVDDLSPQTLSECLSQVSQWSRERREAMEADARAFAWGSKTQLHQGRRICQFLGAVAEQGSTVPAANP